MAIIIGGGYFPGNGHCLCSLLITYFGHDKSYEIMRYFNITLFYVYDLFSLAKITCCHSVIVCSIFYMSINYFMFAHHENC